MASDFTEVDNSQVDPENRNDTDFTWESTYDGPTDSEGNPDPEERDDQDFSWESEPESPTTVISIRGANQDVIDSLSAIAFVPGSACGMSQAISYIRYWSRRGTQQQTPVEQEGQQAVPDDPQEKIRKEVENNYSEAEGSQTNDQGSPVTRTVLTVPENSSYQSRPRQPIPTRVTQSQPSPKAGKVVSANPSGNTSVPGVTPSASPSDAVWMFLFNPEELQLSSGPDYNRADTWGVSDEKNSGQPLSWRSNKNRKLSFGKVLLHGYSFGKRVDTLEAGLQQLFMARNGENGSDGPPVLEFVWGKRVFGPCVIQNIQVRERGWDKGILVNAEVSFELEQVPEWTINDGYVDVLRPGRQPTINDPTISSDAYKPESVEDSKENTPASEPGGGGGRSQNNRFTLNNCRNLLTDSKAWNDLIYKISTTKSGVVGYEPGLPTMGNPTVTKTVSNSFESNLKVYLINRNRSLANSFYGSSLNKNLDVKCKDTSALVYSFNNSPKETFTQKVNLNSSLNENLLQCSKKIKDSVDKFVRDSKCNNYSLDPKKSGPRLF